MGGCVSGTHGKTTTTSMITTALELAGRDPSAVIGGKLPLIHGYGKAGKGDDIVIEACEFSETFLKLNYMFYNLNDYKSGFSIRGDEIKFQPSIGSSGQTSTSGRIASLVYSNVLEYIVALRGVDIGELSSVDSCYIYADIRLRKVSSETEYSSDFKQYKWDFSTMKKTELSPKVTTTGNGEDKRVSSVVTNDDGKTVINITVNVTGGSGGNGGAGGDGGNGGNGGESDEVVVVSVQ